MTEAFATVRAFKGFLSTVDANVFLEMVLEFEGLATFWTFELAEVSALVMADHVTLEPVNIGECLVADLAVLGCW